MEPTPLTGLKPSPINAGINAIRRVLCLAGLCVLAWAAGAPAQADILWFNASSNRITYASGGTDYLQGHRTDFTAGCFVQLIYAGSNGTIGMASIFGTGVTEDDEVVATAWMGMNVFGVDVDGWLNNSAAAPAVMDQWYFVRAWSAPASDYLNGWVPSLGGVLYGNSTLWQYPGDGIPPADTSFNFGGASGFSTLLTPVPEPGTLALCALGLLAWAARRRSPFTS